MAANKDLKANNMDAPSHKEIYEQGYEMRKKVVGEEYVERSLKASGSDFMRPLQQFATVCMCACVCGGLACCSSILLFMSSCFPFVFYSWMELVLDVDLWSRFRGIER
jgi:hypothetical protein